MTKLTTRQAEVLELIRCSINDSGMPPTRAEIAQKLGFRSVNAAEEHLRALARKGAIEILSGRSRGIRIPGQNSGQNPGQNKALPIISRFTVGSELLTSENIDSYCATAAQLFQPNADFLLRMPSACMQNAGILPGDLLAVQTKSTAENGQIVVVQLADAIKVKRFQQNANMVTLTPDNPAFEVITVAADAHQFAILGVAVGVIREAL